MLFLQSLKNSHMSCMWKLLCSSGGKLDYTTAWQKKKNRKTSGQWKSKEHTNRFWSTTWKRPDAENDFV